MKKVFFVTSPKREYLDLSFEKYIVPESFWMNGEINNYLHSKEVEIIKDPFGSEDEYVKAQEKVSNDVFQVIHDLLPFLNEYNSISFSDKQWTFLLFCWLMPLAFSCYVKYDKINRVIKHAECELYFCNSNISVKTEYSAGNDMEKLNSVHDYHTVLYERILSKLHACGVTVSNGLKTTGAYDVRLKFDYDQKKEANQIPSDSICHKIFTIIKKLRFSYVLKWIKCKYLNVRYNRWVLNPVNGFCGTSALFLWTMPAELRDYIVKYSNRKVGIFTTGHMSELDIKARTDKIVDTDFRKRICDSYLENDEFRQILFNIVVEFLPTEKLENFKGFYKEAVKLSHNIHVSKIYTDRYFPDISRVGGIFAALKMEEAEIIDIQHSGGYSANPAWSFCERSIYDCFLTWGWKDDKIVVGKERAVACMRFIPKILPPRKTNCVKRILFVSSLIVCYDNGTGDYCENYTSRLSSFFDNVTDSIKEKIVLRVRNDHTDQSAFLPKICQIEDSTKISLKESACMSDLVICDHNSSAFLESLMSGVPTIVFDGYKYKENTSFMERHCKKLKKSEYIMKKDIN